MEIERSEVKLMNLDDNHIPEWLLLEVLTRLPAKLVCRSKLVSKQWLSLILEPSFVRTYISRASFLSQPWTFISHFMHHEGSKSLRFSGYLLLDHLNSQVVKPSYCVLPLPCTQQSQGAKHRYMIFGVSNGLVLYGLNSHLGEAVNLIRTFNICSPVTGEWIALPPFTCCFILFGWGFLTHVEDGFLKSYTVVRVDMVPRPSTSLRFEVFSSEIGEWQVFTVPAGLEISLSLPKQATTLNGILHWIAGKHGIVAYDPHQSPERMRIILYPADMVNRQRQCSLCSFCDAHQGKLRYIEVGGMFMSGNQFPEFKLWELNDYSSGDWSLQHTIGYRDVQHDTSLTLKLSTLIPISFHPFDLDIVFLGYDDFLITYNIKTAKLEVQQKCFSGRTPKRWPDWCTAFLLMIPPWPISIPYSFPGAAEGL